MQADADVACWVWGTNMCAEMCIYLYIGMGMGRWGMGQWVMGRWGMGHRAMDLQWRIGGWTCGTDLWMDIYTTSVVVRNGDLQNDSYFRTMVLRFSFLNDYGQLVVRHGDAVPRWVWLPSMLEP